MKLMLMGLVLLVQTIPAMSQITGLNDDEKQELGYILEEEKLALDVYSALGEKWGLKVFDNIKASEQRHLASVKEMAEQNAINIPSSISNYKRGVFKNEDLQSFYNEMVNAGNQSVVEALKVGAKIEELDIQDLQTAMENTDSEVLTELYISLRSASENHLRAFARNLDKRGLTYKPIILSNEYYTNIIEGEKAIGSCCRDKKGREDCNSQSKNGSGKKGRGNGKACCK